MDLILAKNNVLDFVLGKVKEPSGDVGKEKYKEIDILAMNLVVDGAKDNLIPYISTLDSSIKMYHVVSKFFTIKNIGKVESLKNER